MSASLRASLALVVLWGAGCRPPEPGSRSGGLRRGEVLLVHTNDLHAHYLPSAAPWVGEGGGQLGGFAAIDAHIRALRASEGEALYLDAGDLLSGTPLMEVEAHGVAGGAMLDFLHAAGCDAWAVGNHELDRGLAHARGFVAASEVPVLAANLKTLGGTPLLPGSRPRVVLEHNGLKIGVFGLITTGMGRLVGSSIAAELSTPGLAETARAQVAALEPEVDLVVALTHAGIHDDRKLAAAVEGIDLIVGGHTHTAVEPPEKVGDTWIVQAGSYGRQLGVVRLSVDDGEIEALSGRLVDLDPDALPAEPGAEVAALVRDLRRQLATYEVVVGQLPAPLERAEVGRSDLGGWAAEAVRVAAGADVGVVNAGGLRADLAPGPVSRGDLYQVFPFGNEVSSFTVSGAELMSMLLMVASREAAGRVPLQLSGAQLVWREHLGAPEVVAITVGGQPLDLQARYRVATSSFLADQSTQRFGVSAQDLTAHGVTVLEAAVAAVQRGAVGPPAQPATRRR